MGKNDNIFKFLAICGFAFFLIISSVFAFLFAYGFVLGISDSLSESGSNELISTIGVTESVDLPILDESDFSSQTPSPLPSSSFEHVSSISPSDSYVRTYSWNYNGYDQSFTLTIPKDHYEFYRNKPHSGKYFNHYALSEYDSQLLGQMIDGFKEQGRRNGFTDDQIVLNVIAFVQSMPYTSDSVTTGYDEYPRYPIETLVDGGGDCEDSSILAAALLNEMGYGTVLISLPDHMALGVKGSDDISGAYYEYNGSRYYYVETTSSGFKLGEIPAEYKNSKAQILMMDPTPLVYAKMSANYMSSDLNYVYYKVRCDFTNSGPTSAKNVRVKIFAESSPYDMTHIWPPEQDIYIGTIQDDGTGWAEGVVKIPHKNYTRFTCVIYGDNFNYVDLHTDVVYIN